jgi:hypothetical protein
MKLFTIGDSISQGFMSLAAARTDLSYSGLLARKLGLRLQQDYRYPDWPAEGIPLNMEAILRRLNRRYGSDISGFEWLTVLQTINDVVDAAEDFYERGPGAADRPYPGGVTSFHNVSVTGFTVADAWLVTPDLCRRELRLATGPRTSDGFLTGPDNAGYRTALKVLNPSLDPALDGCSQLEWLRRHATTEGVENLALWLGANNALGAVVSLRINQAPPGLAPPADEHDYLERARRGWNLWHPDSFRAEYAELLRRVDEIMRQNVAADWKVFVGTVPLVTIVPLAKGVGDTTEVAGKGIYFKYYTYFPFEEEFARTTGMHLTMQDALHIDDCIRAYNAIIAEQAQELNDRHGPPARYHVVDIADALNRIAFKRNAGQPTYEFPAYFDFVHPRVNTKYYHADADGQLRQGGLFSLDGVHPSAIAHGLLAYEFLKVMRRAGVVGDTELRWDEIFANDLLYTRPITIMQELYRKDELAKHLVGLIRLLEGARGIVGNVP